MSKVFKLLQDRFGMGREPIEVLQEKAQRISVLSGFLVEKLSEKKELDMSIKEVQDVALLTRTVHPENEGIYNGSKPFDPQLNSQRGEYSLRVAEERGIDLTETQKDAVLGKGDLLEAKVIKLAETIIAVQYSRIQRGVEKPALVNAGDIMAELKSDGRVDQELVGELEDLEIIIANEMKVFAPQRDQTPEKPSRNVGMEH